MIRVIILGSGGPQPDPDAGGSSILLTIDDTNYLIDCGPGATHSMVRAGISPASINRLFISHLHYDHCLDLPFFVLSSWIGNRDEALKVFGPVGTKDFVGHLFLGGAFDADIKARSQYGRRKDNLFAVQPEVTEFGDGPFYEDERLKVRAVPVDHVPPEIMGCFGMRFDITTADGTPKSMVFSSDTAPLESVAELSTNVDLLIHECAVTDAIKEHRTATATAIVHHTTPKQLGELAAKAGVKSLIAIHQGGKETTNPVMLDMTRNHAPKGALGPGYFDRTIQGIRESYDGPVRVARDLMRVDL